MRTQKGLWGIFQWFEEHGPSHVHPDDLEKLRSLSPNAKVFHVVEDSGIDLTLEYGNQHFRVKPELFRPVAPPAFNFGERVSFEKDGRQVTGVIAGITWHFKKNEPVFSVGLNGKVLPKHYWSDDLRQAMGKGDDD